MSLCNSRMCVESKLLLREAAVKGRARSSNAFCFSKHLVCLLQVRNPREQFIAALILTVAEMVVGGPIKGERLHPR